jgi:hypothetical protein
VSNAIGPLSGGGCKNQTKKIKKMAKDQKTVSQSRASLHTNASFTRKAIEVSKRFLERSMRSKKFSKI